MRKVKIFEDELKLAEAAAIYIVDAAGKSIATTGRFAIALSGGKTPATLYHLLSQQPYVSNIDWKKVFVFWSDERCVPADHPDNNSLLARKQLLEHINIPAENIFTVQVQMEPHKGALQYEQMIKAFFKDEKPVFNLILLGLGDDGHTASLFPGTEALWKETDQLIITVPKDNSNRISMTPAIINIAENILLIISGENKAEVLKEILEEKNKELYPVQYINKKALWYLDASAARKLKKK